MPTIPTSPAAVYASTSLSDSEKADIRRFCGYPPYGAGASGFVGHRFFQAYGLAEYRMNNMAPAEYQNLRMYTAQLYTLEAAVWTTSANLDTDQAAVWTHNKNELRDRVSLYRTARLELCALLGVPPGPNLRGSAAFDVVI